VLSIIGKFVSHSFKKEGHKVILCDVPTIGQFALMRMEQDDLKYEYVPSAAMLTECAIHRRDTFNGTNS